MVCFYWWICDYLDWSACCGVGIIYVSCVLDCGAGLRFGLFTDVYFRFGGFGEMWFWVV